MPIEIRELHIRVAVNAGQDGEAGGKAAAVGNADEEQKKVLVAECVEQVLQILQNKGER
jgi:hypothetical protein